MGVLPLHKDSQELKAAVEPCKTDEHTGSTDGGVHPTIIEYLLKPLPSSGIDLDELIGPREGVWRRQPLDFDSYD